MPPSVPPPSASRKTRARSKPGAPGRRDANHQPGDAVSDSGTPGLDLTLIRKYNVPGPRYTSYPTAPRFSDTVERVALLGDLERAQDPEKPFSLYIHLPFCESNCWFCGCTKVITRDRSAADRYLDYLEKEITLTAPYIHPKRPVGQLHFGGGTPTFLTAEQILRLGRMLRSVFHFDPDCESGVEVDPRRLERKQIEALRAIGCNRASLGVQDNNPDVQRAVNRIQPPALTEQTVRWLREEGFASINIDLIYGLPLQTPESFAQTVEETIALAPDRFALFSYAHVPWIKPAQKIFEKQNSLPGEETKLAIFQKATAMLTAAGYDYLGMDHFARADDELSLARRNGTLQRNFQGYSTRAGSDICALGMSAISQTPGAYRQNEKELPAYFGALDEGRLPIARGYLLNDDDRVRRETIMRLMCDLALPYDAMSARTGVDFPRYFGKEIETLEPLAADGLVTIDESGIQVTAAGRFLIRNIAMCFDAYLGGASGRFSKTI